MLLVMTAMAGSKKTKALLGFALLYPTYAINEMYLETM